MGEGVFANDGLAEEEPGAEEASGRAADPAFALSKSEAGHPQWGPVYQRLRQ